MVNPKPRPSKQNRIPIKSKRCPSKPRNVTCERSGSLRLASPPTSPAWAKATDARLSTANAGVRILANRHALDATLASQKRMGSSRDENFYQDDYVSRDNSPSHSTLFRDSTGRTEPRLLQSRARFHCKTLTGVLELGRLGFCPRISAGSAPYEAGSKTSLCSISRGDGQTYSPRFQDCLALLTRPCRTSHSTVANMPHQPNSRTVPAILVSYCSTPRLEKIACQSCSANSGSPTATRGSDMLRASAM